MNFNPQTTRSVPLGRFFSLQKGRVGQYLSPRVLSVRTPFQKTPRHEEACYFGFEKLNQAQKFAQHLASFGYRFVLQRSQVLMQFPYEIKLFGNAEIAGVLAHWDRVDQRRLTSAKQDTLLPETPQTTSPKAAKPREVEQIAA